MAKRLTDVEKLKIAELAEQGLTYHEIASRINRAAYTVKRCLDSEFRKYHNEEGAKWRKENPEKFKSSYTTHRINNPPDHTKAYRKNRQRRIESVQKHYRKNKAEIGHKANERHKQRKKVDPSFRIACNLRTRIAKAVRRGTKGGSVVRDLGCTIDELKAWLESQFTPGMLWNNYGDWHIDHIKPLASFDLTNRIQFLQACHFTNLQPLWAFDNLSKGDRKST